MSEPIIATIANLLSIGGCITLTTAFCADDEDSNEKTEPTPNPIPQPNYLKSYSPLIESRGETLRKHHMLLKKLSQKNKEVNNVNCTEEKKRTPLQEKMHKRISEEKKEIDTRNKEPLKMNSEEKTNISSLEI